MTSAICWPLHAEHMPDSPDATGSSPDSIWDRISETTSRTASLSENEASTGHPSTPRADSGLAPAVLRSLAATSASTVPPRPSTAPSHNETGTASSPQPTARTQQEPQRADPAPRSAPANHPEWASPTNTNVDPNDDLDRGHHDRHRRRSRILVLPRATGRSTHPRARLRHNGSAQPPSRFVNGV